MQGEGASAEIARGIRYFDKAGVDIIIIGRGGGSIEDLWAFNEMPVADAIYEADTPIISGTGHEVDMTIADYCADVRAATPSAACELAIPDMQSVFTKLSNYREALDMQVEQRCAQLRQQMILLQRQLEAGRPDSITREKLMMIRKRKVQESSADVFKIRRSAFRACSNESIKGRLCICTDKKWPAGCFHRTAGERSSFFPYLFRWRGRSNTGSSEEE